MEKFRRGFIIFAVVLIIAQLTVIDYSNLSWLNNAGSYLGIFSMICVIISVGLSKHQAK